MFFPRTLFALALALAAAARAEMVPVWATGGGTIRLTPLTELLPHLGIELRATTNEPFRLSSESRIKFVTPWGSPDSFLGGSLLCSNGLTLAVTVAGTTNHLTFATLELHALKDTGTFELRDDDDEPVLILENFDTRFDTAARKLFLHRGEARITGLFAEKIERPELTGHCIALLDCEIEIHELEARIERRKAPPPYACGMPANPEAVLRLTAIENVQQLGGTGDTIHIGAALTLENPGPFVAPATALHAIRHTLTLTTVQNGTTTQVTRLEQTTRYAPARNPCPDETKFIPGALARHTLADHIRENTTLSIPTATLTAAATGQTQLHLTATTDTSHHTRRLLPTRTGPHWHFRLAPP